MSPYLNRSTRTTASNAARQRAALGGALLLLGAGHVATLATRHASANALLGGPAVWPPSGVVLNELRTDQPGTDNDEFAELLGPPGTPLDGVFLVVVGDGAGLSGCIEEIVDLSGHLIGSDGLLLVAQPQMTLAIPDVVTPLEFENSDNLTILLVQQFVGSLELDLDPDDDGELDVAPWSAVLDAVSLVENVSLPPLNTEWWYAVVVGPGGNGDPPFLARRCPASGAWLMGPNDPGQGVDTPGAANGECLAAPRCPADLNGDSVVDGIDLAILLVEWGPAGAPAEGGGPAETDLNADGMVDSGDLGLLLASWPGCEEAAG